MESPKCPDCDLKMVRKQQWIKKDYYYYVWYECPKCGHEISENDLQEAEALEYEALSSDACLICGAPIPKGKNYCYYCEKRGNL